MLYSRGTMVEFASIARMRNRIDNNVHNQNDLNDIWMNIYENCFVVSLPSSCARECIHSSFAKKEKSNK